MKLYELAVLAPNLVYATARGAVISMIPLLAVQLDPGVATAALIAAGSDKPLFWLHLAGLAC